ncbi:MAG: DUF3798 domain-containing protein [Clostridia bacterium]|nr:DUF3798 domain-containing protein [Clostridia bacterium]
MKRILAVLLTVAMLVSLVGCGSKEEVAMDLGTNGVALGFKIGVVTGTVSQGEEEYRAAEAVKLMYGDQVILQTYPDKFMDEQETTISNILSIANDPEVKAIVICQAVPGTSAAIDKVREIRDDILIIAGVPGEAPDTISPKADVVLQGDELGMGVSIIAQAAKMGATTFVHYSFPRHMSYPLLAARRDIFKSECEARGMKFVDATAPDPTGDAGVPGAQQFILEDIPRKVEEYGENTNFFSTNCSMQEPLIKSSLENGAIVAQQCCPSPYHGYPGALGISIPEEKQGDVDYIIAQISDKVAVQGGTGRFATWPVPVNMMFVQSGVDYAIAYNQGKTNGKVDKAYMEKLFSEYAGVEIKLTTLEEGGTAYDNFLLLLSDYITF